MNLLRKLNWYLIKLPSMLMLMIFGFILEFMITLPLMIAYRIDNLLNGRPD